MIGSERIGNSEFEEIEAMFSALPDEDERLHFLINLGRRLEPLLEVERREENRVSGCQSTVWLVCRASDSPEGLISVRGESDSLIVSGLIAVLLSRLSERTAREILSITPDSILAPLRLEHHLSPGRRNGLAAMVERVRQFAIKNSP